LKSNQEILKSVGIPYIICGKKAIYTKPNKNCQ